MPPYLFKACIFCYTALDPEDIKLLTKEHSECLCITQDCCLAAGDDGYGVGLVTESDEICKLGLLFCTLGLKKPEVLCKGASHCLCIKEAHAIPFDSETVANPICAICCVQLVPKVEIMATAPGLPSMVR